MTEAMPFLQKYDITFLRPPTIYRGVPFFHVSSAAAIVAAAIAVVAEHDEDQKDDPPPVAAAKSAQIVIAVHIMTS